MPNSALEWVSLAAVLGCALYALDFWIFIEGLAK